MSSFLCILSRGNELDFGYLRIFMLCVIGQWMTCVAFAHKSEAAFYTYPHTPKTHGLQSEGLGPQKSRFTLRHFADMYLGDRTDAHSPGRLFGLLFVRPKAWDKNLAQNPSVMVTPLDYLEGRISASADGKPTFNPDSESGAAASRFFYL